MKKEILILSLLIFILSISCVSANDLNTTDTLTLDDNNKNTLILEENYEDTLSLDDNNETTLALDDSTDEILSATGNRGELQSIINNAREYETIHLTKNYEIDDEIVIDKTLIIDGGYHMITGSFTSRLFNVTADTCYFTNLTLLGGDAGECYGGAIYAKWNVIVINCGIGLNSATFGGAIFARNSIIATKCSFLENYAYDSGGALFADRVDVDNCIFENNTADCFGGSIFTKGLSAQFCDFLAYDNVEFICCYNGDESRNTILHLYENTMSNLAPCDIIYDGYVIAISPINVIFNNQTVKKGQTIEIGTVEDNSGNTICTYGFVDVEIINEKGKVVDNFTLEFNNGYYYTCNLDPGVYTVNASISQYRVQTTNVKKGTLTVTSPPQDKIELKASDVTKYYKGDEVYTVTVYNNGKTVSGASVTIKIKGIEYTRTTNKNGVATLTLTRASGTYEVTSSYKGKEVTSKVTIKPTITGKDATGTTKSTKYSVTALNSDGTPLKNTKITFKIGSDTYSKNTNDKGVATLDLKLKAKTYEIEATNPKTSEKIKNKLTVKEETSVKIEAKDFTKYYGGSERFAVKITDNNGKALANKEVKITINKQTYTKTTDTNGITSMNIGLNSNVYPTTVECDGQKVDVTVTVKATISGNDITKMYQNDTQYYATFVDSNGNPLKNTEVQFNINGVFYKKTTDSNGVARMNINLIPKTYIITAENPITNEKFTNKITVKPTIVENYDLTKYYKSSSQYTLRLLGSNGKPVGAGVTVELNINGVFYYKQSDANGYIGMNINLPPGKYIVTANYNGFRASNTITVLPV